MAWTNGLGGSTVVSLDAAASALGAPAYGTASGGLTYHPLNLTPDDRQDVAMMTIAVLSLPTATATTDTVKDRGSVADTLVADEEPISSAKSKEKGKGGFFRRLASKTPGAPNKTLHMTRKQVTRSEYLKHYAKDGNNNYIGSEMPADDCVLNGFDVRTYRGKAKAKKAEASSTILDKGGKGKATGVAANAPPALEVYAQPGSTLEQSREDRKKQSEFGLLKGRKGASLDSSIVR